MSPARFKLLVLAFACNLAIFLLGLVTDAGSILGWTPELLAAGVPLALHRTPRAARAAATVVAVLYTGLVLALALVLIPTTLLLLAAALAPEALVRSRACQGVTIAGAVLAGVLLL